MAYKQMRKTLRKPHSAIRDRIIKVLSIAGSDPSGGAGMQIDLKVFQALGAYGMAVPAALTVQNSRGVESTIPLGRKALLRELDCLLSDIKPDAVKTGMLLTKDVAAAGAAMIRKHRIRNVIVDPVLHASSGTRLLECDALQELKRSLLPQALIVTPNISEAEILAGLSIQGRQDMDYAAGRIMDLGPKYVLIKGGHGTGPAEDTLYGGKTVLSFSTPRRKGEYHGTGCVLSSAITVFIARGFTVEKAVEKAKQFVDSMLKRARPVGKSRTKYFMLSS